MFNLTVLGRHIPPSVPIGDVCGDNPDFADLSGFLRDDGFEKVSRFASRSDLLTLINEQMATSENDVPLLYICSETLFVGGSRAATVLMRDLGSAIDQSAYEEAEVVVVTGQGCGNLMTVLFDFQRRADCPRAHVIVAENFADGDRLDPQGHYVFADGFVHLELSREGQGDVQIAQVVQHNFAGHLSSRVSSAAKFRKRYVAQAARFRDQAEAQFDDLAGAPWEFSYSNFGNRKIGLFSAVMKIPMSRIHRATLPTLGHIVSWDVIENGLALLGDAPASKVFAMTPAKSAWYMLKMVRPGPD